jgi:thiol-disulfide isomerase/thioredoxin
MRFHLAILAVLAFGLAFPAPAQTPDFSQTILGNNAPLTVKLKDLDSTWRVFKTGSNSALGIMSAFMPGGGSCYTKGQTVSAGGTVFLIVYKPDAPDMSALMAGSGGPPKPKPLTAETVLKLSLLNLQATTELEGIHTFNLSDEVGTSKQQAIAITDLITKAIPAATGPSGAEKVMLAKGAKAPAFTVKDAKGAKASLASYRGKVVVLDFWSTWCGPCQESLPSTNEVAAKYKSKGVVFLAVNVWDHQKDFNDWLPKHKQLSSLHFLIDPSSQSHDVASKLYNVSGIPTQYVIDRNGRVVGSVVGYGGDDAELVKNVKAALAGG